MKNTDKILKEKIFSVLPTLNERQKRIFLASEAIAIGHGGVSKIARIAGISRPTIIRGKMELVKSKNIKSTDFSRTRIPGGGRKKIVNKQPGIIKALGKLVDSSTRGDPESPLRWTSKSLRKLSAELNKLDFDISYQVVRSILQDQDFSLQANRKNIEGKKDHPDRDDQFIFIGKKVRIFQSKRNPVISVDAKKKELVGNYKNGGREWAKKKKAKKVLSHDFPDPKVSKAVPYGVYDISDNSGWVNVGIDGDTAEFAVESIRQWWLRMGKKKYSKAKKILICADSGGSNASRSHLWKRELQKLANKINLSITVCHFPPGTSKWNKIEHKLFSFISINWRGKPLIDYKTVVSLIAGTKTTTGLVVKSRLDRGKYEIGIKVSKEEIYNLNIKRDKFHGEWNYTISPKNK